MSTARLNIRMISAPSRLTRNAFNCPSTRRNSDSAGSPSTQTDSPRSNLRSRRNGPSSSTSDGVEAIERGQAQQTINLVHDSDNSQPVAGCRPTPDH
jgi:hypothetical protein